MISEYTYQQIVCEKQPRLNKKLLPLRAETLTENGVVLLLDFIPPNNNVFVKFFTVFRDIAHNFA